MSLEILLLLFTGAGAGIAHVYLGVDHLAALVPVSHGGRLKAFSLGIRWGLGHSVGVILVAAALLGIRELFEGSLDFEALSLWSERLVGVMLILVGAYGMRLALIQTVHSHTHEHDGEADLQSHQHLHVHSKTERHDPTNHEHHDNHALHGHTSLFAGTLHGLAGTGHLWGVLPALALSLAGAGAYLIGFAAGSMLAMGSFAAGYGYATARMEDRLPNIIMASRLCASGFCLLVGVVWLTLSTI